MNKFRHRKLIFQKHCKFSFSDCTELYLGTGISMYWFNGYLVAAIQLWTSSVLWLGSKFWCVFWCICWSWAELSWFTPLDPRGSIWWFWLSWSCKCCWCKLFLLLFCRRLLLRDLCVLLFRRWNCDEVGSLLELQVLNWAWSISDVLVHSCIYMYFWKKKQSVLTPAQSTVLLNTAHRKWCFFVMNFVWTNHLYFATLSALYPPR